MLRVLAASLPYLFLAMLPPAAHAQAAGRVTLFSDDFETHRGWQTNPYATDTASSGAWERGDPQGTNASGPKQLGATTSGQNDLSTGRRAGTSAGSFDVDGGVTSIASPGIRLIGGADYRLGFRYYLAHASNSSSADYFRVRVVGPSATVTVFEERGGGQDDDAAWATASVSLDAFAGTTVRLLFQAADAAGASLVEAAVDDVSVTALPAAIADLTVTDIELDGSQTCYSGTYSIVVAAQVENAGSVDAADFVVEYNGFYRRVAGLQAGQATRVVFSNWDGGTTARVTADLFDNVPEDDEGNNALEERDLDEPSPPPPCADQIVGYYTQWSIYGRNRYVQDVETSGAADRLTVINYAFSNVVDNKCLVGKTQLGVADSHADYWKVIPADRSVDGVPDCGPGVSSDTCAGDTRPRLAGNFDQLRRLKERHPHLKVLMAIGGASWSKGFYGAARPENREGFVRSCIDAFIRGTLPEYVEQGGVGVAKGVFDGIDIDWEYPGVCIDEVSDPQCGASDADRENFVGLMAEFRRQLDEVGAEEGRRYLLTAAVSAGEDKIHHVDVWRVGQIVDWLGLLSYDFHGAWERTGPTNFHSALYPAPGDPFPGAGRFNADWAVSAYLDRGLPADKLLLGVPFYGRGWVGVEDVNDGLFQPATEPARSRFDLPDDPPSGIEDYFYLKELGYPAFRDPVAEASWIYSPGDRAFWAYDDPVAISNKTWYAVERGLRGIMFWELAGDTTDGELVRAIHDTLQFP